MSRHFEFKANQQNEPVEKPLRTVAALCGGFQFTSGGPWLVGLLGCHCYLCLTSNHKSLGLLFLVWWLLGTSLRVLVKQQLLQFGTSTAPMCMPRQALLTPFQCSLSSKEGWGCLAKLGMLQEWHQQQRWEDPMILWLCNLSFPASPQPWEQKASRIPVWAWASGQANAMHTCSFRPLL